MPILTVTSAATARGLVTLATLKDELGITGTASDVKLARWIADASATVCGHCRAASDQLGRRTFAVETMTVAYDSSEIDARCGTTSPLILPWRIPVTSIASVVEDGVTLEADEYQAYPMAGLLWRLDDDGNRTTWAQALITVTMTAGWDLAAEEQPEPLRRACIELVKLRWHAAGRDPAIKSESVDGIGQTTYGFGPEADDVLDEILGGSGLIAPLVG